MISVVDLAFEIWFGDSGQPDSNKKVFRANVWDPMVARNQFSEGMDRAYKHAVTVLRLAGTGALEGQLPTGSLDGTVH